MGVKGLWSLLAPFCEKKPLFEIGGETIAIDLSGWICDSQNVTDNYAQPKLYLRNLYFRTTYLLLYDVIPVFVLEGQAPELKRKVMEARRQLQFIKTGKQGKSGDISRRRFKGVLTQCEKLLSSMGLQCVTGAGEAEAMCAHLNSQGLVSGVISQDSDCFVYGAKRLYRNFSVAQGCGGSVDVCDLNRVQKSIDFGRNKMVALALLCGSDYNGTGVDGVGLTSAFSFLQQHSDADIIPRLVSWSTDIAKYKEWGRRVADQTSCTNCGHGGPMRVHTKQGCPTCVTHKGCKSDFREWRVNIKMELQIRSKALEGVDAFPDPALLNEFLFHEETTPPNFKPTWSKPDLIKFTKLMAKAVGWTECYCLEKFLPLMTRWHLLNPNEDATIKAKVIVKKRNPKGVACYQVLWYDFYGLYDGLITDDQIAENEVNLEDLWTTVERQDLIQKAYPQLVEEFEASKAKSKKTTTKKAKENAEGEEVDKVKIGRKRKAAVDVSFKTKSKTTKKKTKGVQKTLHSFIMKETDGTKKQGMSPLLQRKTYLFENDVNRTADLLKNLSLDLLDDVNDSELSDIVDNIIQRDERIDFDVNEYFVEHVTNRSVIKPLQDTGDKKKRISYFFDLMNEEYDAFEKSIDLKNTPDEVSEKTEHNKSGKSKKKRKSNGRSMNSSESFLGKERKSSSNVNRLDEDCNRVDYGCEFDTSLDNMYKDAIIRNESDYESKQNDSCVIVDTADKDAVLTLEERLFGKNSADIICSTPDKTKQMNWQDLSSDSILYTPLEERMRRLKENL